METQKIRKAVKGEIPDFYPTEKILPNQATVIIRSRAIEENLERRVVRLPVYTHRTIYEVHIDGPRRLAMLEGMKKLHVQGQNRISYRYRVTRFIRKVFLWTCFWLFVFCVAYTIAGLVSNGLGAFKLW